MPDNDTATRARAVISRFEDIGDLTETVEQWDLDFIQLDRGRFEGRLFHLQWDELQLQRACFGRGLEQRGSTPRGMRTFGIPATSEFSILWRGHRVRGSDIMIFPPNGELHSVSRPGFDVFTFSSSERRLADIATTAGVAWQGPGSHGREVLECEDGAMARLRSLLMRLTGRLEQTDGEVNRRWTREELGYELPVTLLSTLTTGRAATHVPTSDLRSVGLDRAEQFITQHSEEPVRVSELCRAAGVSERTLRYAFREKFGVGPKAYLAARQLALVQRVLRRTDPRSASIAETAGRFGFWHMGQFAADYRRQFGELPSTTLHRDR